MVGPVHGQDPARLAEVGFVGPAKLTLPLFAACVMHMCIHIARASGYGIGRRHVLRVLLGVQHVGSLLGNMPAAAVSALVIAKLGGSLGVWEFLARSSSVAAHAVLVRFYSAHAITQEAREVQAPPAPAPQVENEGERIYKANVKLSEEAFGVPATWNPWKASRARCCLGCQPDVVHVALVQACVARLRLVIALM